MNLPVRLRRLRRNPRIRALFAETNLSVQNLVQPYFIVSGAGRRSETRSGMGLWQLSADQVAEEAALLTKGGIGGVMFFGVPDAKRDDGKGLEIQLAPLVAAIAETKATAPDLPVLVDVCLCSFTTHGHCGLVEGAEVVNDESVAALSMMAVHLARAGADVVCPSDMMDGRVAAIRSALDAEGFQRTSILSYAVKMASAFYGPFREAAHSSPSFGDRKSYQMPVSNRREARREILTDVSEGADALMIKPAISNLDLIRDAREACDLPLFAYQVSGEYAMLRAAADAGLIDFDRALEESLLSIRRAGADVVVSYAGRAYCLRA